MKFIKKKLEDKKRFLERRCKQINNALQDEIDNKLIIDYIFSDIKNFKPDMMELIKKDFKSCADMVDFISILLPFFESNPTESQVILAKEYLRELHKQYHFRATRVILRINEYHNRFKVLIDKYNSLIEKVSNYDSNTYITEEEYNLIINSIDEEDVTEDIIDELTSIGVNNNIIVNQERISEHLVKINNSENIDSDRTIFTEHDKLFIKINYLLANWNTFELVLNNIALSNDIQELFKLIVSKKKEIDNNDIELADLFRNDLDELSSIETLLCATCINIIDGFDAKDKNKIIEVLNHYHEVVKNNELFNEKKEKTKELVSIINTIIETYYDEEKYTKFISSYNGLVEEQLIDTVGLSQYRLMLLMKYIHDNKNLIDSYEIDLLNDMLVNLNKLVSDYKEVLKTDTIIDTPEEKDNSNTINNIEGLVNYFIVLDEDRLVENIKEITVLHDDARPSLFPRALKKLMTCSHSILFQSKTCKPIKYENDYGIREERADSIRICFKKISTKDGHIVYVVLKFAYGSCDGKQKSDNLIASIKEYEAYYQQYQELEEKVKNSTLEECAEIINKGLEFYNSLLDDSEKNVGDKHVG